jgi:Gdp/GTP exchange factor required for growth at low temperatures
MDLSQPSVVQDDPARMSVATTASIQSENSFFGSSEEDYGVPTRQWFPNTHTVDPEIMSIDNMLSETDDESIAPARRGPKRLPNRRDFEFIHRSASPSENSHQSRNRSSASSHNSDSASERQYIIGAGGIQAWHLEFIESDDEEPGGVEAAMRRLEGQIDKDRQKHKEVKVDGWLKQVKKRLENGDANSVSTRSDRSTRSSVAEADTSGDLAPEASASNANIPESIASVAISVEEAEPQNGTPHALHTPQTGDSLTPTHDHVTELPALPMEHSSRPQSPRAPTFLNGAPDHPPIPQPMFKGHRPTQSLGHKQSFIKIGAPRAVISNKYTPSAIPPLHRSFILINRSQQLAEHFTMIERDLFMGIKFEDLVSSSIDASEVSGVMDVLDWNVYMRERTKLRGEAKKGIDVTVPTDLAAVEARFYLMVKFTASEILLTQSQERPALVSKFIRLAFVSHPCSKISQKCSPPRTEMLAAEQLLYTGGNHHWSRDYASLSYNAKALGQGQCLRNAASRTAEEVRILSEQFPNSARGNFQSLRAPCYDG